MYGITGGIGSGKSTIANELRRRGYVVYDTDSEAKRIILHDSNVRQQMTQLFGDTIYEGNTYRTDLVAAQIFESKEKLERLNGIVHPAVRTDILEKQPDFVESAIMYESGFDRLCEKVVAVIAPAKTRIERVIQRDGSNAEKVRMRMRAQMSNCHMRVVADYIVENNGRRSIERLVTNLLTRMKLSQYKSTIFDTQK